MKKRYSAPLALLGGALIAVGSPPFSLGSAALVTLALYAGLLDGVGLRRALLLGWLFGVGTALVGYHWIVPTVGRFTGLGLPLCVVALLLFAAVTGLPFALGGALTALARPKLGHPLAVALGLLVAERFGPSVIPYQLAAPLVTLPWLPQAADVLGVSGLGALLAGCFAVLLRAARARFSRSDAGPSAPPRWQLGLASALLALATLYGAVQTARVRRAMDAAPRVRVALVQPNFPPVIFRSPEMNWHWLSALHAQTNRAMMARAQLVVWPEGAYPFSLPHEPGFDGAVSPPIYPARGDLPTILTGTVTEDRAQDRRYNSAVLRMGDGRLSMPVSKRTLVPFGEHLPVVGFIPWVRRTFVGALGLSPGEDTPILETPSGLRLGVLNCFEDILPDRGAEVSDTDLLVNITNDGWFGESDARWQHLMLARWRAIESRRELLRAVNTGVTTRVDALGNLAEVAPTSRSVVLLVEARRLGMRPLAPWVSYYAPYLAALALALALGARARDAWRERKAAAKQPVAPS